MDSHERCEKACAVLQRTNDGDELYPPHLGIIQALINGNLTDEGVAFFEATIYAPVMAGNYAPPAYHGVADLTLDGEGYVRWKGIILEHFSWDYAYSERSKSYAEGLGRAAAALEAVGQEVTSTTVWDWLDEHGRPWRDD